MNTKTFLNIASATIFALAASAASASQIKTGTIQEIDLSERVMVLLSGSREQSYQFDDSTLISLFGNKAMPSALKKGQNVKVKLKPSSKPTRGEIVAVNHQALTADIKLKNSNQIQTVRFANNVAISGLENFNSLRAGHLVTVR